VLEREYGPSWDKRFKRFTFAPIAAASIGQVHRAETHDGRLLALKIQYPGVRASIDSDVDNLALLSRTPGLVPAAIDTAPLLARLREQLHLETDYIAEARSGTAYRLALGEHPVLTVPVVHEEHSTAHILATDFLPGVSIDQLATGPTPQSERDRLAQVLCELSVREFFAMRLVQTDPNFGNYLVDASTGRIGLLDFGATQVVPESLVEQLRAIGRALRDHDTAALEAAALAARFVTAGDPRAQTQGIVDIMQMAGEPLCTHGPYDFGASDLFKRGYTMGRDQYFGAGYARTPPPEVMLLQRKFVGSFMLCTRLRARVDVGALFRPYL
jgi:predicted unusual protein kinase regulating ubiquinone biosynthesis (AarF/ABC1/UbiB family)